MFRFADPYLLILLGIVPVLVGFRRRRRPAPALRVSTTLPVAHLPPGPQMHVARLLPVIKYAVLVLMVIALARPQWGTRQVSVKTEGINIILAVDISESMAALDFRQRGTIVNRLEAVKGVISQFVAKRTGDRIGMVVFGSRAFTQLPLTRDYNTIAFMLDHLKIGSAGPSTAVGDAIGISLRRLEDVTAESNIVILLTDGKSNAGELAWEDGARIAAQRGVKIHTIGVGSRGKATFLVDGLFGQQYVYRQVDVDWEALKTIAESTGGQFFAAKDTGALEEIYRIIDTMEKTRVETEKWVEYQEMFAGFLGSGLVLYLLCLVLASTRFLRIP